MNEHYFSPKPTSTLKTFKLKAILRNKEINFTTSSGLFSFKKLDRGSELLINKSQIKENAKILDLGCGYGIIGLALKILFPSIQISFCDINERAIQLTKINLKEHHLEGDVILSNGFEKIKDTFTSILLNPPQTAGKELCFKLIEDAKEHLIKKGTLQIVARHNKGGKELSKKMQEIYGNVEEIAKKAGYRIYLSKKLS